MRTPPPREHDARPKGRASGNPTAKIAVPGHPDPLVLTHSEFERLITDDIARSGRLLTRLLERNQLRATDLSRLYLTVDPLGPRR